MLLTVCPLPELGDRLAAQFSALSKAAKRPVAVVAESEGTCSARSASSAPGTSTL
ncbi:MAG TPA: hypothetical protein VFO01_18090 [Trebonia sp.]|nr:hypothetical protein [Trebonia sp.]